MDEVVVDLGSPLVKKYLARIGLSFHFHSMMCLLHLNSVKSGVPVSPVLQEFSWKLLFCLVLYLSASWFFPEFFWNCLFSVDWLLFSAATALYPLVNTFLFVLADYNICFLSRFC